MIVFRKLKPSILIILIYFITLPIINTNHHNWSGKEGVITWDIKSYYAYLPATFIYKDLSLKFIEENQQKFGKWIWPINTPTGKKAIVTSMGVSIMYAPFFFIAHTVALISDNYESDGYSRPYHYALTFSAFIYFIIGLIILRKLLLNYYSEGVTALTMLAIGAGTNLLMYITYDAPMSHSYSFVLMVAFIWNLVQWVEKRNWQRSVILGLISGLIVLIRPTNIVILVLIPLWGVNTLSEFIQNIKTLLANWKFILIMALTFIMVWVPQFAYWKYISGKFFYFTYGELGGKFFWANPQISKVLFSYEKGWYVYTPIMLLATLGIYFLIKKKIGMHSAIIIFLSIIIYVLSSWWCWWFGGSFGQRSMIDFYGLMSLPLAALIEASYKKIVTKTLIVFLIFLLIAFNLFQTKQYNNNAIHYWWMNKEAYWTNFLKLKPSCKYWQVITIPDYSKARKGIYEAIPAYDKRRVVTNEMIHDKIVADNKENNQLIDSLKKNDANSSLSSDSLLSIFAEKIIKNIEAEKYYVMLKVEFYLNEINTCDSWKKEVENKSKRKGISFDEMAKIEANRVYQLYCEKYDTQ
jgi:hypothetical protein